ncbi:glutathione-dependent reductase [Phyllobacterium brassicacearum]|uniref:Glutathione-dependent reductase n=1 Tax=Phyllobacterium brassicacearum TaxID=314235 RepID=A0A2P7B947_9HYPH|nr:glutathione S-transferase family protein [Phyllobacterium brassicacearum]PSH62994.1 glutathione-dependent reductase [Phyllobacterium brassicacearum]TDQ14828.1 putative glutathione S-transferase [Phyllobacterium brassicacearum]
MGRLMDGVWHDEWYDTGESRGRFIRAQSQFRNWITRDGTAGPTGNEGFIAEPHRYHLYVSYACPWAHRTLIFRALKGLEHIISVSVVDHYMGADGWTFLERDGSTPDQLFGYKFLHEVYTRADPRYTGRVTVPVLWDKTRDTIVSNESSEIIRMLNSAFNEFGNASLDFYPEHLREEIDEINAFVYPHVNNGVYRAGFATTQEAYLEAYHQLFDALDRIEARLSRQRYLAGNQLTEADWRLFTTLLRFDPVYVGHFKCNRQRLADYPNLPNYVRDLYQVPGVAPTVNLLHIKSHYYGSHKTINPTGIIPAGPAIDYAAPHDRGQF